MELRLIANRFLVPSFYARKSIANHRASTMQGGRSRRQPYLHGHIAPPAARGRKGGLAGPMLVLAAATALVLTPTHAHSSISPPRAQPSQVQDIASSSSSVRQELQPPTLKYYSWGHWGDGAGAEKSAASGGFSWYTRIMDWIQEPYPVESLSVGMGATWMARVANDPNSSCACPNSCCMGGANKSQPGPRGNQSCDFLMQSMEGGPGLGRTQLPTTRTKWRIGDSTGCCEFGPVPCTVVPLCLHRSGPPCCQVDTLCTLRRPCLHRRPYVPIRAVRRARLLTGGHQQDQPDADGLCAALEQAAHVPGRHHVRRARPGHARGCLPQDPIRESPRQ